MQHPKTRGGTTGSGTKPKNSGPKAIDHRWQCTPSPEKKRAIKTPDLETQLARLQEELKKTKSQLAESQSFTKQAQQQAEEAKNELAAMTVKLDELWACEESKIQELRIISQDRDRAWESELKAVQKHLATAIAENQKLNIRLQKTAEYEAELGEELKMKIKELEESERRGVESEGEVRRLKVQMEQWRKAAEVAAAMVLGEGGGKVLDLSCLEDESLMKKTNNMLKKIGVLFHKGEK